MSKTVTLHHLKTLRFLLSADAGLVQQQINKLLDAGWKIVDQPNVPPLRFGDSYRTIVFSRPKS